MRDNVAVSMRAPGEAAASAESVTPVDVVPEAELNEQERRTAEKLRRHLGPVFLGGLADPEVLEVGLNPDGVVWIERFGDKPRAAGRMAATQAELLIATVAAMMKTTVTRQNPILECPLPIDGSRLTAVMPPCVAAPALTIRKRAVRVFSLEDYVRAGTMDAAQAGALRLAAASRMNILVAGGPGSGKTTLTNAVLSEISRVAPDDRIILIEDLVELQCESWNKVAFTTTAFVEMSRLLKTTLRFRSDRIVVGEVRGPEARTLVEAWNTGNNGGLGTLHANTAASALVRLEQMVMGQSIGHMGPIIGQAVHMAVFIERTDQGRRVQEVSRVLGYDPANRQYLTQRVA